MTDLGHGESVILNDYASLPFLKPFVQARWGAACLGCPVFIPEGRLGAPTPFFDVKVIR